VNHDFGNIILSLDLLCLSNKQSNNNLFFRSKTSTLFRYSIVMTHDPLQTIDISLKMSFFENDTEKPA